MKRAVQNAMRAGAKVSGQVSGRLGGAELHVLSGTGWRPCASTIH